MTNASPNSPPAIASDPRPGRVIRTALILLSLIGLAISLTLSAMSLPSPSDGVSLAAKLCAPSARVNCEHILASDQARIGPISSALVGAVYFAALLLWFVAVGLPNRAGRRWHLVPLWAALAGNAVSVWFIYLMAAKLPVWCTWCVAAHVVNAFLLVLVLIARPKKPATAPVPFESPYPSRVRGGVTLGAAVSLSLIILLAGIAIYHQVNSIRFQREYHKLASDIDYIVYKHRTSPQVAPFAFHDTDLLVGSNSAEHTLVVFYDMECQACFELHTNIRGLIAEFPKLRCVLVGYPMGSDCNPLLKQPFHRHACEAAHAVEAFNSFHASPKVRASYLDRLFRLRHEFAARPYTRLATTLWHNLTEQEFEAAMKADDIKARVAENIALGNKLGIESTPALYLNNRKLSTWNIRTADGKPDTVATKRLWQKLLAEE